jgi:flagellar assembly protein FliH
MGAVLEQARIVNAKRTTIYIGRELQHIQRAGEHSAAAESPAAPAVPVVTQEQLQAEYERGRDDARHELVQAYAALNGLIAGLKRESQEMLEAVDQVSTVMGLKIASRILDRELSDPAALQSIIHAALAHVPAKEKLVIRLNPADRILIESLRNEDSNGHSLIPTDAILMADASVGRGGCVIDSTIGTLDARKDTQLRLIEQALLANVKVEKRNA